MNCSLAMYYPAILCFGDVRPREVNDRKDIMACDVHWYKFLGHKKEKKR